MREMIVYSEGHIRSNMGDLYKPFYTNYSEKLINEINKFSKEDIAAAAQFHLEEILSNFVSEKYEENGINNLPLCLAGGVW